MKTIQPKIGYKDNSTFIWVVLTIIMTALFTLFAISMGHSVEQAGKTAFKGFELYSWRDTNGQWLFTLLPGTNRLKTEPEIKGSGNRISTLRELERRFSQLAAGENVFWFNSDAPGFDFPDQSIIKEVTLIAERSQIILHQPHH